MIFLITLGILNSLIPLKNMEIIEVFWKDIFSDASWQDEDCHEQVQLKRVRSIGYKVHENEEAIWLAQFACDETPPEPEERWGSVSVIPKGVITDIIKL